MGTAVPRNAPPGSELDLARRLAPIRYDAHAGIPAALVLGKHEDSSVGARPKGGPVRGRAPFTLDEG